MSIASTNNMEVDTDFLESQLLDRVGKSPDGFSKISVIDSKPLTGAGDGSLMISIKLSIETNRGEKMTKSFMYKTKRIETNNVDLTKELHLFKTETLMYGTYLRMMNDLMCQHSDEQNEAFAPKLYGFRDDVILMEDLKETGFKMIKLSDGMDLNHAKVVMKCLAKFHALSMTLIRSNKLDVKSKIESWWFHKNLPLVNNMFRGGVYTLADVIEQDWSEPEWKGVPERLRKATKDLGLKFMELSKEMIGDHLLVLNHGDCWTNNTMFTYDDLNFPKQIRLLDFQLCHFNSLSWDLTYMMYNCIFGKNRIAWMPSLLDVYSETLSSLCEKYGCKGRIPKRHEIQQDMDRIMYFGFHNSVNNVPVFISSEEPDFEFDLNSLAVEDNSENPPVAHKPRYYRSDRVSEYMKDDLREYIRKKII